MKYVIHTDGGARGNPGPAAIGVVIQNAGIREQGAERIIARFGKKIGIATNNIAEYTAVIEALGYLVNRRQGTGDRSTVNSIHFFLDSTLVVNQLNGLFKVKEPHLRDLLIKIRALEAEVGGSIMYTAIPREQNREADLLVNQSLDG